MTLPGIPSISGYHRIKLYDLDRDILVTFEPAAAGEPIHLERGSVLYLLVRGDSPEDEVEISRDEHGLTVWPSPSMSVRAFNMEGERIEVFGQD